jgi:hypothetical protein
MPLVQQKSTLLHSLIGSAVLLLCLATAHGQTIDVTGIALGSSYDKAVQMLAQQGFRVTTITFPWAGMTAEAASRQKPAPEYYTIQAVDGKVVWIQHQVSFARGSEPNSAATIQGLKDKYGSNPSTFQENVGGDPRTLRAEWIFDIAGRVHPINGPGFISCGASATAAGGRDSGPRTTVANGVGSGIQCAKQINVDLYKSDNVQTVGELLVRVEDDATLKSFFQRMAAAQQQKQNSEGRDATKNKAPL